MLEYQPLDSGRNEIRMISLHKTGASGLLECSLDHVSLDDYSPEYHKFLQLEGDNASSMELAVLWDLVRAEALTYWELRAKAPTDSLVGAALRRFSNDDVYQQPSFKNAKRYRWGDFCALSYEWGNADDRAEILVNGRKTTVTNNLAAALEGIGSWWYSEHHGGKMRIWIDALCINQRDIPERNLQVKRMRDIYSLAFSVLVWTGPALETGQEATSTLLNQLNAPLFEPTNDFEEKATAMMAPENDEAWRGLMELAARSYWQRLWVIQEILLATTGACLCYGNKQIIASQYFGAMAVLLRSPQRVWRLLGTMADLSANRSLVLALDRCDRFQRLNRFKFDKLERPSFLNVMSTGRMALQSDMRDKVYGLLGLMDPRIHDAVVPDYSKPLLEVYHDFAIAVIKSTGRLETLLQGAVDHETDQQLPSWVPNWSIDNMSNPDVMTLGHYQDTYYRDFRAAGDTLHIFQPLEDARNLLCRGFKFDVIDGLACSMGANAPHDEHDVVLRTAESKDDQPYDTPQGLRDAFWGTMTISSSIMSDSAVAYIKSLPSFESQGGRTSYFHVIARFQQCNRHLSVGGKSLRSIFPQWSDKFENLPEDEEIVSNLMFLMLTFVQRRFVLTEKGYMGLCPKRARKGDAIYILRGCNLPLILRPNGDGTFYVVSECYVQGLMNGEAMEALERNGFEEMDLVLR